MIKYSLVQRGSLILAEFSQQQGDYSRVAKQTLARAQRLQQKQFSTQSNFLIGFLFEDDFSFLAIAEDKTGMKEKVVDFLDVLSKTFFSEQNDDQSNRPDGRSWKAYFTNIMKTMMQEANNVKQKDGLTSLEENLQQLNELAQQSVEQLLEREVKLNILTSQSQELLSSADNLKYNAQMLRQKTERAENQTQIYISIGVISIFFLFYYIFGK